MSLAWSTWRLFEPRNQLPPWLVAPHAFPGARMVLAMEDPEAEGETRWVLVGMSGQARLLTIAYTLRNDRIRLISARKATKLEARDYAQGI